MNCGKKRKNFKNITIVGAVFLLIFAISGCAQGPTDDDLYTVFISYRLAQKTTTSVNFEEGSTSEGVIVYNFDNVTESTYGYTFDGLVRDTFTADANSYWGMLTCTGGAVTTLFLNYTNTDGVFTGTVSGDNASGVPTAIDLSTLDYSSLTEAEETAE